MFRSLLLMAMGSLAALRTRRDPWVNLYLIVEVASNLPFLFGRLAQNSYWYEIWYDVGAMDVVVAGAMYTISRYRREGWTVRGYAIVEFIALPVFLVSFSVLFLHSHLKFLPDYILISLGDSGALLALGVALCTVAYRDIVAWTIASMWFALAIWEYSYTWGFPFAHSLFHNLNQWLPCAIVCVAFFIIAIMGNTYESLPAS